MSSVMARKHVGAIGCARITPFVDETTDVMILTRTRCPLVLAMASLLLAGCVTHSPMSESVIFHDPATRPMHTEEHGFGGALTATPASRLSADLLRLRRPESQRREIYKPLNTPRFSAGAYWARYDASGRFGFAITAGLPVAGIDGTVKLWQRNYLSAAVSAPGQGQVFLQHRTYNREKQGVSVGVGYRREAFTYLDLEEWIGTAIERVDSFGVRGFAVLRGDGSVMKGARIDLYVGYVTELDRATLSIGVTTGGF